MKQALPLILSGALAGFALPGHADEPVPFEDFTFKRVKVPTAGTAGRITVQIDPEEQARRLAPRPKLTPGPEPEQEDAPEDGGAYAWYWDLVSPQLANANPARLQEAVASLTKGSAGQVVPTPRLQQLQGIADTYGKDILLATIGTSVSPALVLAVIGVESSGQPDAVSSAGAQGLMQLIPATAERFGVANSSDPVANIRGGVAYLDWLMKEFNNDPVLFLAAYNAGENAVKDNAGVPAYAETRAYVPRVLAAWTVARNLCLTPPELLSDGCVFALREARQDD